MTRQLLDLEKLACCCGADSAWQLHPLDPEKPMTTHEFTGARLLNGKRAYGPNSGRQSLVIGRLADRVHTKSLANAQQPVPLAQRNVPTPQSIGSAGHVWLLAYADGHCSTHQADEEIGEELGNWRCFANENTHLLPGVVV